MSQRVRRTMLITPGDREERIAKSATLGADAIVLDLEDGVGPPRKAVAREVIARSLRSLDFGRRERLVRINAMSSPESAADLEALPLDHIDALFVPKVESAEEITRLAAWLDANEGPRAQPVEIVATIETPRGLFHALPIADASKRTTALFFGSGDYTTMTGSAVTERSLAVPRALIVAAAAAAGIQAIDAAYFLDVKDGAAAREDALLAKELGFVGKLIFHPNQLAPVNEVFTPSTAEIARARRIIAGYAAASAKGEGTAVVDGEFIAIDIALWAERVLDVARRAGALAE